MIQWCMHHPLHHLTRVPGQVSQLGGGGGGDECMYITISTNQKATPLTILLLACSVGLLDGKLGFPEGAAQSTHHPPFHLIEFQFQKGPQGRGNVFDIAEVVALGDAKIGEGGEEGGGEGGGGRWRRGRGEEVEKIKAEREVVGTHLR